MAALIGLGTILRRWPGHRVARGWIGFEVVGDYQLERFRARPANRDTVLRLDDALDQSGG